MIEKETVKKIAKLARLKLDEKEVQNYQKELSKILDYIEILKEVNVSVLEDENYFFLTENVIRKDEAMKEEFIFKKEKLLELAPEIKNNYFKVRKIL